MTNEVEELRAQVTELKERVTELENRLDGTAENESTEGIREFVESFEPSSHTERSLSIA